MTPEKLIELLKKSESPTLDFKRELKIYRDNGRIIPQERDELIRDILSLANGNARVVGEDKHLIFGASNLRSPDGNRELHTVNSKTPDATGLLQMVNSACEPQIANIDCGPIIIDNVRLFVVTIPPTPHVHETNRILKTPKAIYHEYTVFVRHHESIRPASMEECETLRAAKLHYLQQRRNINPIFFGALNNAWLFAALAWSQTSKMTDLDISERIIITLLISGTGAFTGWAIGQAAKDLRETTFQWRWYSLQKRIFFILAILLVMLAFLLPFVFSM